MAALSHAFTMQIGTIVHIRESTDIRVRTDDQAVARSYGRIVTETKGARDEVEELEPALDLHPLDRFIAAQRRLLDDTLEPDDASEKHRDKDREKGREEGGEEDEPRPE